MASTSLPVPVVEWPRWPDGCLAVDGYHLNANGLSEEETVRRILEIQAHVDRRWARADARGD